MPAFFDSYFWNLSNAEFWVGAGLVLFLAIVAFAGVPKVLAATLDAQAAKIQADLDEAERLRAEAKALLAQLTAERAEAQAQAQAMIDAAHKEAERLEVEARAKLEDTLARRQQMAERRIAQAEAQAMAEVKAAAADLAVRAAEQILANQSGAGDDRRLQDAIQGLASARLN